MTEMNSMKSEALSTAILIVLCCSSCSEGMRLVLNREIPKLTGARNACGILRCEENVTPASTGSSPDGGFDVVKDSSSSIFNMTIFKNQPANSMTFGDEHSNRVVVASLTSEHPNITNDTNGLKIIGILKNKSATVWLEMFRHDDCSSDFICEVHGLDSKGRVFLSTSTLVQQRRETYLGDGDVDLTTSLQLLAQQLDIKLAAVSNSLSEVENKMEDKILSFERRIEGKIESAVTDIRDRVHSLENRLEDKIGHQVDTLYQIDAKVSAMNENDACSGNDVLERLLTGLKQELSDALENAVGTILDNIDARFSSSEMHLTQNLTDSITEVILSNDDTLNGTLDKILSSQMVSLQSVRELESNIYNITCNTPSVPIILSQINNTMVRNIESVMTDILTPSDCKRGMLRPASNYPFPHTLVYPRGKSGQSLPYLCDMFTDGGGWIVIQRRSTGNVDFYRDWATYKKGFGTLNDEFWLGNERIHALTSSGTWELRVDLKYKGKEAFAQYKDFSVESEANKYRLRIGSYSGNAGDSLSYHRGQKFSTFDNDNDESGQSCSKSELGGWWYRSCDTADLNSKWNGGADKGLEWNAFAGSESASFSEMKIRRVS